MNPASFWRGFWTWFGVGLFLLVAAGALIFGGWRAGWWFSNQNTTRSYQQVQNGTSNQDTLRMRIDSGLAQLAQEDVQVAAAKGNMYLTGQIKVEEAAQAYAVCTAMAQVTGVPLPQQQAGWYNANCSMGVVAPSSKYFIPGEAG